MTPIEDLLRVALRETPVPPLTTDPLAEVDRRVRGARRGLAAATGTALAVAVAIIVPLVAIGSPPHRSENPILDGSRPSPSQPSSPGDLEVWRDTGIKAVTIGPDGTFWLAVERDKSDHQEWAVVQQAADGSLVRAVDVPGPIQGIAYGAGRVWAYRTGDGGYPDGVLDAVNPTTGDVATLTYPGGGPTSITFVDAVYVSVLGRPDRIERIEFPGPSDTGITATASVPVRSSLGGVAPVVATEDGRLWTYVQQRLVEVRDEGDRLALATGDSFLFPSDGVLGRTGPSSLWIADGPDAPSTLVQLDPRRYARGDTSGAYGDRIAVGGQPTAVAEDGVGGVYVAIAGRSVTGIAYYSEQARASGGGPASAFHHTDDVTSLTADPHGGVVAVTLDGSELHWDPTGLR